MDDFSFNIKDKHIAILSKDGAAGDEITQLLARLLPPTSGTLHIGDADLSALPEAVTGRRIGYSSPTSKLFNASIRDNLYYGLKHQPLASDDEKSERRLVVKEALAAGNSTQDIDAEWVDIKLAGAANDDEFTDIVHEVIECVELDDELLTLALRTAEDIEIPPQLAEQIVTLRGTLIAEINQIESGAIIEPLDATKYIHNLTVAENLLFGTPVDGQPVGDFLAGNAMVQDILMSSGLAQELGDIGLELAGLMVELFSDVPDDSELFEQFSFITAAELPDYQQLVTTTKTAADLNPEQRAKLLAVSFKLCPARHRLELVTPAVQEKVLAARKNLMQKLGAENDQLRFFDRERYNHGMSVQENLLFGVIAYAKGHLQPKVTETIRETLKTTNLNRAILIAGLNCPAGAGGSKLSAMVRQKLVLARALLKNPDILIINNTLAGLDAKSHARILDRIIARRQNRTLIQTLTDPTQLQKFQHIIIVEKNKLLHSDSPDKLVEVIAGL